MASLIVAGFFLLLLLVPESPRYYITLHKYDKARTVLKRVALFNRNRSQGNFLFTSEQKRLLSSQDHERTKSEVKLEEEEVHYTLKKMCRRSNPFFSAMIIMPYLWFASVLLYYGITFSYSRLEGDIYVIGTVAGCTEIVAYLVIGFIADWIGRKPSIIIFFFMSGLGGVLYCFVYQYQIPDYVMLSAARFGAASVF